MKTKKEIKKSEELLIEIRCETLKRPLIITQKEFQNRITHVLCAKRYTCEECRHKTLPLICAGIRRIYNKDAKRILNSLIK